MKSICVLQNRIISEHSGGYEIQVYNIFRGLHRRGWKVSYVADGDKDGVYDLDGIQVHTQQPKHYFPFFNPPLFKLLTNIQCSIVYQRSRTQYTTGGIGIKLSKKKKAKFVFSVGSADDFDRFNSTTNVWKTKWPLWKKIAITPDAFLKDILFRRNFKACDLLIVQNTFQKEKCYCLFKKDSIIIRSGHPVPLHQLQKSPRLTVCWIANIRRIKQPELFIQLAKACSDLSLKTGVRFVMVAGRKMNAPENRKLIAEAQSQANMDVYGSMTIDEANKIMENASVLVNTSQYEGFSNTYIQAWMRETPVVTLHCDPDGVIQQYRLGFHSRSFEQMVTDVRQLIENEELRKTMGRNARTYAIENHDIDKIVSQFDAVFSTLISN